MLNVMILGNSGSGKTTAAEMMAKLLGSPPPRNCSDFIIEDYAVENTDSPMKALNLSKKILANKGDYRKKLFEYGLKRQASDPAYPVSEAFRHTNVVTGVRTPENLAATRKIIKDLVVVWIERSKSGKGSTDKLGPEDADIVINNDGTFEDLEKKLMAMLVNSSKRLM